MFRTRFIRDSSHEDFTIFVRRNTKRGSRSHPFFISQLSYRRRRLNSHFTFCFSFLGFLSASFLSSGTFMLHDFLGSFFTLFQTRHWFQLRLNQSHGLRLNLRSHDLAIFDARLTCFTSGQTSFLFGDQVTVTSFLLRGQVGASDSLAFNQQFTDSSLGFLR